MGVSWGEISHGGELINATATEIAARGARERAKLGGFLGALNVEIVLSWQHLT
jgi:hypothetical protein